MGVEIFDNERVWRATDGQRGVIITGGHEVDCLLSDYDIQARVEQREDARSSKDFNMADSIRDDLRRSGIELMDGQRMWVTTDGRQGTYRGTAVQTPTLTTHGAHGMSTFLPLQQVVHHAVIPGLPASAVTNNPAPMAFSTASIVALVAGREQCRDSRDWSGADEIRQDLRSHGVDVWDKEKVWRANDGRNGTINRG